MDDREAQRILREFASKYIFNALYRDHLHGADISTKRDAVAYYSVELPPGESLDDLCIVVHGSVDNLPADVPKPETSYKGLLVLYKQ